MNILPTPKKSTVATHFGIRVTRKQKPLLAMGLVLLAIACDPAFRFEPLGWQRVEGGAWEFANEDLHLVMLPPGGMIGSTWLAPEPAIENRTAENILIGEVTLVSKGVSYQGKVNGDERFAPGEKRRVPVLFDLRKPAAEALGEEVVITFPYRIGEDRQKQIVIKLKKT